jgi:hypothetical protein
MSPTREEHHMDTIFGHGPSDETPGRPAGRSWSTLRASVVAVVLSVGLLAAFGSAEAKAADRVDDPDKSFAELIRDHAGHDSPHPGTVFGRTAEHDKHEIWKTEDWVGLAAIWAFLTSPEEWFDHSDADDDVIDFLDFFGHW